jgi:RND family efflux transporter MFP subunit
LVVLAALSCAGVAVWPGGPGAAAQDIVMRVRVDTVRNVPLAQTVSVIGRLVAQRRGEVAARINGPIEAYVVEVGDRVERGQLLAVLDTSSLRAARDLYAGRLSEARAAFATRKAELVLARQEYARLEGLKTSAAFNQARFDDARQRVAIAQAQVGQAETAIATARADLQLAEINLENAEIRAPYAGVITDRLSEAGAYLQTGDPLVRMVGDRDMEIEAEVPFQYLAGLTPGVRLDITLDDGTRHQAEMRAMLPSENPLTRTRTVRFVSRFGATERPLAHDQSVTLDVPLGAAEDVLSVHKDAVVKQRGEDMVYLVVDGAAQPRAVKLGAAIGSRFQVLGGLQAGDRVVVRGNERLKPGDPVEIVSSS